MFTLAHFRASILPVLYFSLENLKCISLIFVHMSYCLFHFMIIN